MPEQYMWSLSGHTLKHLGECETDSTDTGSPIPSIQILSAVDHASVDGGRIRQTAHVGSLHVSGHSLNLGLASLLK